MTRAFGSKWTEKARLGLLVVFAAVCLPPVAAAQSDPEATAAAADTTTGFSLSDISKASKQDTIRAAEPDSTEIKPFDWITSYKPTITGSVQSNLRQVLISGGISASGLVLDGLTTNTSFNRDFTDFRQVDKERNSTGLNTTVLGNLGEWGTLNLTVNRSTSDETEITRRSGVETTIETDNTTEVATADLKGGRSMSSNWSGSYGLRGEVRSTNLSNSSRDLINDRALAGLTGSGRLNYQAGAFSWAARLGGARTGGNDQATKISDGTVQEGGASTVQDTIGTAVTIEPGAALTLTVDAQRARFDERRLDLTRNQFGQIDNENQVAQEREERVEDKIEITASSRPLSPVRIESKFTYNYKEKDYQLNPQGFIQDRAINFDVDGWFAYASSGSLQVSYKGQESWTDLKRLNEDDFRGRQFRRQQEVRLQVSQALMQATSITFTASQRLTQNVLRDRPEDDDDQLLSSFNGRLTNTSIPRLKITVGGTFNQTRRVALGGSRVGNNEDTDLFEVKGAYEWSLSSMFTLKQDYRLNIAIKDFHTRREGDSFVKQGRLETAIDANFGGGGTLSLSHVYDLRNNGSRLVNIEGPPVYNTTFESDNHLIDFSMAATVFGVAITASSSRRFEDQISGGNPTYTERGDLRSGIKVTKRFLTNRASLNLQVSRVLAYGPERLLDDSARDYYEANSSFTLNF